ncbi:hypothetical protein E1091_11845 [Micromonospora fluostatini]|uniref:Uncharacterized protein n=1 Tax=Micromonospora fluostatini TaxID=1629071 RepID=A0ABY2DKV1_9ACTN|nr:hypothetical protein E1091_11845 [Micromonospora fluostatini]
MTRAPANLMAVRSLLLTHLNTDRARVRDADLEPAEVGIVGDAAHRGGYHCGSNRVVNGDYSVVESSRDRAGLTLDASALDVGDFTVTVGGKTHTLHTFSVWLAGQCAAGAADTRDIREIIYSPDGRVVKRWDRLGRRSSGDRSHLWHTHISFFRDATKAGRDQTPVFRRYLTTIGLIKPTSQEDDMPTAAEVAKYLMEQYKTPDGRTLAGSLDALLKAAGDNALGRQVTRSDTVPAARPPHHNSDYGDPANPKVGNKEWTVGYTLQTIAETARATRAQVAEVLAMIAQLTGRDPVDEPAIVAGVLAGLSPQAIAAAIPTDLARQVADELGRRFTATPTQQ